MAFNKRQRQYLRGMATANANNNKANKPQHLRHHIGNAIDVQTAIMNTNPNSNTREKEICW